jgi:hypothetical protein
MLLNPPPRAVTRAITAAPQFPLPADRSYEERRRISTTGEDPDAVANLADTSMTDVWGRDHPNL